MKRSIFIILASIFGFVNQLFADSFTDAIQDLAIQTACLGQYSMTEAGGGWYDDPHDYYTPQMMAQRFADMSGNMTRTTTFYGICFDYAQFAYNDVEKYKKWYNEQGMYEGQFWIAGVHENSNQIILSMPTTKANATIIQNGVYIKTFGEKSNRNVKTHKQLNGVRATHHAWFWIQRADGVWFWIDPTWTDNLGYVVYGYVSKSGEEIQCRPDEDFCITYPSYLKDLPLPPSMGTRKAPSKTANSTNRQETIQDAGTDWISSVVDAVDKGMRKTFIDVNYNMRHDYIALLACVDVPVSSITDKSITPTKMGFGLEMPFLYETVAVNLGLEYLQNMEDDNNLHAGIIEFDFTRRLFNNIAWYLGGGAGVRFDTSNEYGAPKSGNGLVDTGYFAWKADTGFILNLSCIFTKIEVSYNNVIGFSVGAGVGFGIEL